MTIRRATCRALEAFTGNALIRVMTTMERPFMDCKADIRKLPTSVKC
jgi:hypothetical protein